MGFARHVRSSDRRRARAVLAAAGLDRRPRQRGRDGKPPRAGASPKDASAAPSNDQTYVLLANAGTNDATVTINFLRTSGVPVIKQFNVPGRKPPQRGGERRGPATSPS